MPTIRVDDDVWKWLQQHARPLEDTPNSVLRRIAQLDPAPPAEKTDMRTGPENYGGKPMETVKYRFTGEQLRKEYGLRVRHCLYHKDGRFFERLVSFPGALCDPEGFLQFETEADFEKDHRLNIGQKVNVPGGISTHPRYQTFPPKA